MIGLIQFKAARGDAEAIKMLKTLRNMGLIKEEPKVTEEPTLAEIFDMCIVGSKQRRRDYRKQRNQ